MQTALAAPMYDVRFALAVGRGVLRYMPIVAMARTQSGGVMPARTKISRYLGSKTRNALRVKGRPALKISSPGATSATKSIHAESAAIAEVLRRSLRTCEPTIRIAISATTPGTGARTAGQLNVTSVASAMLLRVRGAVHLLVDALTPVVTQAKDGHVVRARQTPQTGRFVDLVGIGRVYGVHMIKTVTLRVGVVGRAQKIGSATAAVEIRGFQRNTIEMMMMMMMERARIDIVLRIDIAIEISVLTVSFSSVTFEISLRLDLV